MDTLIQKMNNLQQICLSAGVESKLDLPQIVVLGSQSSGKTSVLENIVGIDFLPRGTGIVTRRPLILQLVHNQNNSEPVAEFGHKSNKKFNITDVRNEIILETDRVVGKSRVSPIPIILKLSWCKVPTLTLIDLPGLVKVPTSDQPKCICEDIEKMCLEYASNANAIILAISAANTDITNSDALMIAKTVDPDYDRTLGVLTKLDLMDKGTDAINVLSGKSIRLRFGFVPIVSRSQADILKNKNITEALKSESEYFSTHQSYSKNKSFCGTSYLISKLVALLHEHITRSLPLLRTQIDDRRENCEKELIDIGGGVSPREYIFRAVSELTRKYTEYLHGRAELLSNELIGGARLAHAFNTSFISTLGAIEPICSSDAEIRTLLYNASGSSSTQLLSHLAFERLARNSISQMKPYVLQLVEQIHTEMLGILTRVIGEIGMKRFHILSDKIAILSSTIFRERKLKTAALVGSLIEWNCAYINTRNIGLLQNDKEERIVFESVTARVESNNEVEMIKRMVMKYFGYIRKIVIDQVPKAIMSEMVFGAEEDLRNKLFKNIYDDNNLLEGIKETKEIQERVVILENTIEALKQAQDVISTI